MHASSSLVFTAILALVCVAIATPPACLLSALGVQSNPADLQSLCGSLESAVVGNITEKCSGDSQSSALSVYAATCLSSESVTISITSSASSSSSTGSVSATTTGSAKTSGAAATASAASTASTGTATTSSPSSTATKTNGADVNAPQFTFAILVAGFVAQYIL